MKNSSLACWGLSVQKLDEGPCWQPAPMASVKPPDDSTCVQPAEQWPRLPTNRILKINKSLLQPIKCGVGHHTATGNWSSDVLKMGAGLQ